VNCSSQSAILKPTLFIYVPLYI